MTKSKKCINLGIIGASKMARWHLRAYKKIPEVKVTAICNPVSDRGLKLAKKYDIKNHFRRYEDLLDYEPLDAVDICAPTGIHKEMIVGALKKGLHVYTEKPMCRSLNEAEEIIALNKITKKIIFNGYNYRFWPEILKIKSIIASGELGDIRFIFFFRTLKNPAPYMFDPRLNAGIINELSCHFIDLLYWWGFGEPKNICVHSTNIGDGRINPDTVSLNLDYDNGMRVLIINSMNIPGIYPEIVVAGTKGTLKLKYGKIFLEKKENYALIESLIMAFRESMVIPFRILHNPFNGSCRYFIDCLLNKHANESDEVMAKKILAITSFANSTLFK